MAGFDFQGIKDRVRIEDVFAKDGHVLKRRGKVFVCASPFQGERSPSCYVDPDWQNFHCFSTGNKGDVFDYVMLAHGVSIQDAVAMLASLAGISGRVEEWSPALKPALARHVPEAKPLVPIDGEEAAAWTEGAAFLASPEAASMREQVATWRGFLLRTVEEAALAGKMGAPRLAGWLRRQDAEPGDRRVAFPVESPSLGLVAYHVRLKPRPGERRGGWRFCPSGVGSWPFVLGDPRTAALVVVCEGQWDALAFYDLIFNRAVVAGETGGMERLETAGVAIAAMRGGSSWRLFVEHWLLAEFEESDLATMEAARMATAKRKKREKRTPGMLTTLRPWQRALVIADDDGAGRTWTMRGENDEPCFVEILRGIFGAVTVRTPREGFGKDLNDVTRSLAEAMGE